MKKRIKLPKDVKKILTRLHREGYEAYIVGGCVRDSLMGREPHDWDICTDAIPDEILDVFKSERTILTGMKHGTVTVVLNDTNYEITTFRIDGKYEDHRRPDSVEFTCDLYEDLSRRDFTINAIAYEPVLGLQDPFDGVKDIKNQIIRCVGNPTERFQEDSLRILRAMRFSAQLKFNIELDTSYNIHKHKDLLKYVSKERICSELCKIMASEDASIQLCIYEDVFAEIIPEVYPMIGFEQNNPYHSYDVWNHTIRAIIRAEEIGADMVTKLALLFHDIGKPRCYSEDETGVGHFHGHGKVSAEITDKVMKDLRFDNGTREAVVQLVSYHDATFQVGKKHVRRWINKMGQDQYLRLLDVRECDVFGQSEKYRDDRLQKIEQIRECYKEVINEPQCFTLKDLAISGKDLIEIGFEPGKFMGFVLNHCLDAVMSDDVDNSRDALLTYAKSLRLIYFPCEF